MGKDGKDGQNGDNDRGEETSEEMTDGAWNGPYFPWGRPIKRQEEEEGTEEEEMLIGEDGDSESAIDVYGYEVTLGRLGR